MGNALVDPTTFNSWLDGYGMAWQNRDPDALVDLFSEDATYYEKPFDTPMRGRLAIQEYWTNATASQDQIQFDYEIVSTMEGLGIARWRASYIRIPSEVAARLDGIALVSFDNQGRCTEFREWWHREERGQE